MSQMMPSRRPAGTYAAIAVFITVYIGVLAVIFAPRDMIGVDAGGAVYTAEK